MTTKQTRPAEPDPGYRLYGAAYLLQLAADLAGESEGVIQGTDSEYIHRMRVASRRLRAALPLFAGCFPEKSYAAWLREVKLITRSLGRARDLDVQIAYLREYAGSLPVTALSPGTPRFLPEVYQIPLVPEDSVQSKSETWTARKPEGLARQPMLSEPVPAETKVPDLSLWERVRKFFAGSSEPDPAAEVVLPEEPRKAGPDARCRSGIECLILRLMQERAALQPDVVRAVERFTASGTVESITLFCRDVVVRGKMDQIETKTPYAYREAYYHINLCRASLFVYAKALEDPDRVTAHHEMRIAAKKLRYTMEVYRDLYGDGLSSPMKMVKDLQEFLGDMHDCDVWTAFLPEFLLAEEERSRAYFGNTVFLQDIRPGICGLSEDRASRRREIYEEAVVFWKKTDGVWDQLEKSLAKPLHDLRLRSVTIPRGTASIAFLADIHANLPALDAVLRDARSRGAEMFFCAGDAIGFGPFPEETLAALRDAGAVSVAGNAEEAVLAAGGAVPVPEGLDESRMAFHRRTWKRLSAGSRAELAALPTEVRFTWDGLRVVVVHTPGCPVCAETPESDLERVCREADADLLIAGHTHVAFSRTVHGVRIANTGGCGRSGDGDLRACYLLITREPFSLHYIRVPYDVRAVPEQLAKQKKSKVLTYMFTYGLDFDEAVAVSQGGDLPEVSMPEATTVATVEE